MTKSAAYACLVGAGLLIACRSPSGSAVDDGGVTPPKASSLTFPITCRENEQLEITDRTHEGTGTGTLIVAEKNCNVKITNSRLKGDVIVDAAHLANIEVVDSVLEAREIVLKAQSNNKLRVSGKSTLKGGSAAVSLGVSGEFTCVDTQVEGQHVAILVDKNGRVALKRCQVIAEVHAIKSDVNLKLSALDSTVRSNAEAICPSTNFEFVAKGGIVQGKRAAIFNDGFLSNINLTDGARLEAEGTAIDVQANLKLTMDGAFVSGERVGVAATANASVEMRATSHLHGGSVGLKLGLNPEIVMRSSSMDAGKHAVCAEINSALTLEDSTVEAKQDAFHLASKPRRYKADRSQIVGKQNYAAKSCEP